MLGHQAVAAGLAAAGVRDVFGVMGVGNLHLLHDLVADHDVRYHAMRIEGGAVSAAAAYAGVTGRVGVCAVTQGPGVTNTVTALTAAVRSGISLLLVTGALPDSAPGGVGQHIDHGALAIAAGADYLRAPEGTDWQQLAEQIVRHVDRRGRPLLLDLPNDLQSRGVSSYAPMPLLPDPRSEVRGETVDDESLTRAVNLLQTASRPLVLVGRGAATATGEVAALADHLGAPAGTSLLGKGIVDGALQSIGIVGGFATRAARDAVERSDCLVVVGASLNMWTTMSGRLLEGHVLIRCDVDPDVAADSADAAIVADAEIGTSALLQRLRGSVPAPRPPWWSPPAASAVPRSAAGGPMHPEHVARILDETLPAERTIVVDGGHFVSYPAARMRVPEPSALVFTQNFGSIGLGMGAAVGAAVARPERATVLVTGDGGFAMAIADLETAVRLQLSLLIVVYNDGGYGAEFHHMDAIGMSSELARFSNPAFADVARAMGAQGWAVRDEDGLCAALAEHAAIRGVGLIDVAIDDDVVAEWFSERQPASGRPK